MKWKARFTIPKYTAGTTRIKTVFALLPVYIDGYFVWLRNYEILQAYIITNYTTDQGIAEVGNFINISKRFSK